MNIRIQNSNGAQINSVDDWLELASPKEGIKRWKNHHANLAGPSVISFNQHTPGPS